MVDLLKDALISVCIISVICLIVSTTVTTHTNIQTKIQDQFQIQQEEFMDFYDRLWKKEIIEEPY